MISGKKQSFITRENIPYEILQKLNKNDKEVSLKTNCKFQGKTRGILNYLTGLNEFFPDPAAGDTVSKYYSTRPVEVVNQILNKCLKPLGLSNPGKIEDEFFQDPKTKEISYIVRFSDFVKADKKMSEGDSFKLFEAAFKLTENGYEFIRLRCSPAFYQADIEKSLFPKALKILKKVEALPLAELQEISSLQKAILNLAEETINTVHDPKLALQVFATKFLALLPANIQSILQDISLFVRQCKQEELAERKKKKLNELKLMNAAEVEINQALLALEKELTGTEELNAIIYNKLPTTIKNLNIIRSTHLSLLYECLNRLRTPVENDSEANPKIKNLLEKVVHEQFALPIVSIYTAVSLKRRTKLTTKEKAANSEANTYEIEKKDSEQEEACYAGLNNVVLGFPNIQNNIQTYLEKLKTTWPLNDKNEIKVEKWCESTRGEVNDNDYLAEISAGLQEKITQFEEYKKELSQFKDRVNPDFYANLHAAIQDVIKETELRRDAFVAYTIQLAQARVDEEERKIQEGRYKVAIYTVHKIEREINPIIDELEELWPIDKRNGEVDLDKWLNDAIYEDETTTALSYVTQAISQIQQKSATLKAQEDQLSKLKNSIDPDRYEQTSKKISTVITETDLRLQAFDILKKRLLKKQETVKSSQFYWEEYAKTSESDLDPKTIHEVKIRLKELQETQIQLARNLKELNLIIAELNDPILRETFNQRLMEANLNVTTKIGFVQEILQKKMNEEKTLETLRQQEELNHLKSKLNQIKTNAELISKQEEEINFPIQVLKEVMDQWLYLANAAASFKTVSLDAALTFLEKNELWKINLNNDKKFIMNAAIAEDFKLNAIGKLDASYSTIVTAVSNIQIRVMNKMNRLTKNLSKISLQIEELDNEIRETANQLIRIDHLDILTVNVKDIFTEQNKIINKLNDLLDTRNNLEKTTDKVNLANILDRLNSIECVDQQFISAKNNAAASIHKLNSLDISSTIANVRTIIDHNKLFVPKIKKIQKISHQDQQTEHCAKKLLERCEAQFNDRNKLLTISFAQKPEPACFYQGKPVFSYKDRLSYLMRCRNSLEAAYLESVKNVNDLNEQKHLLEKMEPLQSKVNRVNNVDFKIKLKSSKPAILAIDQEILTVKRDIQAEIDRQTHFQNDAIKKLREIPSQILSEQKKLNQLNLIKTKLMNSKPFIKLFDHMAHSTKFAQINNYLAGIKAAGSISQLVGAVKTDLKNVHYQGILYQYDKSMRENTMHHLYGLFHAGRSKTETYALELEDILFKILNGVYPAHADEEKYIMKKKY